MDPIQAVEAIEEAGDREQVFALILRAARSRTRYAALLSVHTDHLRGRRAIAADGLDTAGIDQLRIPRGAVQAFETAIATGGPYVGPIATLHHATDDLLAQLGGKLPRTAVILPLTLNNRTVALVVAHRREEALTRTEVADLFPLAAATGPVLARILASREEAAALKPGLRASTAGMEVEITYDDLTTQRRLVDRLRTAEAWEELADAIRGLIRFGLDGGDPDEDEQLELLLELGTLEANRLGRTELALEAWRSAQTIDAGDPRVLDALDALFVQQGRWEDSIELTEKRAVLTEQPEERIQLLLGIATMARERLDDDERAVQAYEKILQWDPTNELALRQLEELYSTREQWQPLAGLLLDRASRHADPQTRTAALEAVARMYEDRVGDAGAASLVWLALLRRTPERAELLAELERLAPAAGTWDEIIPECESIAAEIETLQPTAAARIWRHVGRWTRDHLGNRDGAVAALERASRLAPDDRDTLTELVELRRVDGPWIELAVVLGRVAELERVPHLRAELNAELGAVYEDRLGQAAEATLAYGRALDDDPTTLPALVALRRLHRQAEAWDALAQVLTRRVDALRGDEAIADVLELHVELGTILAEHLGRQEDAVRAFQEALALEPKHAPAFHGLQQLYQTSGQTEELLVTTEAEVDAGGADQAHRYADLASAWDELLGEHDRAAACWHKLLSHEPDSPTAHQGLARALRRAEQWDALAAAYRAHLKVLPDGPDRIAVQRELAGVLAAHLDDTDGAIAACQDVLRIDPAHAATLDTIAQLYDRGGQWQRALDVLEAMLAGASDRRRRADLLQRIGQIHVSDRDPVKARASLEQAIALDPTSATAAEGMARLHVEQGELVAAGEQLVRAAQLYETRGDAVRCLADAAWLYRGRLGDDERARDCLRRVLGLDPDHQDAKRALAELLEGAGQWESLWPHLEARVAEVRADRDATPAQQHEALTAAARCAVELGKVPVALELYELATALDPGNVPTALDRAEALYRGKAWEPAIKAYQNILAQHANALEPAQTTLAFRRLALLHQELGRTQQAIGFHHKVLDLDPTHRDSHADLVELHIARGQHDEAVGALRQLADAVPAGERPAILERIGDLYATRLANPARAAGSYLQVLEQDAANRRVLQKLLDLQSATGQWKAALETIDRFLELETEAARRGTYFLASARIRQMKLKDEPGAVESYEQALDAFFADPELDPANRARALEAFEAIDEIVTTHRDWKRQEQAFRRMIKRMPRHEPVLITLWHALGEIYRSRLKHYESAIEAFEVAHSLDPAKSPERGRILAELYSLVGGRLPETVTDRAAKLVEVDPTNPDAYRALAKTSLEAGRVDEAWCACRALVFLKVATPAEDALYRRHQAHEVRKATGILDEDSWELVRHPDEDRAITQAFALTWEGPVALRAGPPKSFELKAKERMQVEGESRVIAKIFRHAARVLNAPLPDVYVQPRRSGRLLLASCVEKGRLTPAVIVGRDLMTGYRDTEVAFSVGGMLALLRPSYYLRLAFPAVAELEAALAAAARLVGIALGRPEVAPLTAAFVAEMQKRVTPAAGEALAQVVARLPEAPDLARWQHAVDAAARRAALLVCGELAAAAKMVSTEPVTPGGPRPSDKVRDLVAYSVSPAYFAARRHMGVTVA